MSGEFWSMGGHAVFVWGSYGAAALVFAWNLVAPRLRRRDIVRRLRHVDPGEAVS